MKLKLFLILIQITNDNDKIKNALKEQMASRVRWTGALKCLKKQVLNK